MNGFSLLSTSWYFNNSCANLYYNRTDTIVDIMFKFTSKFSDDFKTEASSILNPVLPDDYSFFIIEWLNNLLSLARLNLP